ncbi:DUF2663 family protein [Bacillus sp. HMF5848]|uniref:DUF2663 family protein n=1 Tax=Bacillus sp. HMF5848 TaxID=2495421 RepID=UPI000F7A22C3|nr:DUF2663 family protein [Bacillus sp. HMF5848]RSK27477.1 DUF2663 family protein [Bacillus sp. HMF5848]
MEHQYVFEEAPNPIVDVMLQKVVKNKKKFDKYELTYDILRICSLVSLGLYVLYILIFIVLPHHSFSGMISAYLNISYQVYALMVIIALFSTMKLYEKKKDKAEKEFHALRCEIIQKGPDLWATIAEWEKRYTLFKKIKDDYDINLFHENK